MKGFLFGFGIGVAIGVLFAPMSGEETRNNLTERAGDLADSARETFESNRDRVRSAVSTIRTQAERFTGGNAGATNTPATGTEGNL